MKGGRDGKTAKISGARTCLYGSIIVVIHLTYGSGMFNSFDIVGVVIFEWPGNPEHSLTTLSCPKGDAYHGYFTNSNTGS